MMIELKVQAMREMRGEISRERQLRKHICDLWLGKGLQFRL